MGNSQQLKNPEIIKKYDIKPQNIIVEEANKIYYKQDRDEVKLNQRLLKTFFKCNNFSYDVDDDKYK